MTSMEQARIELLQEFRRSVHERVERITFSWITIENEPENQELLEGLLRELHTLKGEAKMMGFVTLSRLAHRTEDVVISAKEQSFQVTPDYGDAILAALDAMTSLSQEEGDDGRAETGFKDLFAKLDTLIKKEAKTASSSNTSSNKVTTVTQKESAENYINNNEVITTAATVSNKEKLSHQSGHKKETTLAVTSETSIRVDASLVAKFSEATSEAVVAHERYNRHIDLLDQLCQELDPITTQLANVTHLKNNTNNNYHHSVNEQCLLQLQNLATSIQSEVIMMRDMIRQGVQEARELEYRARLLRLVPISGLFAKYSRPTRQLAHEHNKLVALTITHRGVSLDRHVVDAIAEPILHLVRNAIDHGIETPAQREQTGKSKEGHLELTASQEASMVLITIADDGAGIDPQQVQQRAISLGLLNENSDPLSTQEAIAYLFRTGFSTRTITTETSGRGVGLDVVKSQVERLGGSVRVTSSLGIGTRFELRVPLMVALTRVLVVHTQTARYAMPSNSILAIIEVDHTKLEYVDGRPTIRFEDNPVPLVAFASVVENGNSDNLKQKRAAIIAHESSRVAITISRELTDTEVIIKPLGTIFETTRLFSGACILDEGKSALIINPAELVVRALGKQMVYEASTSSPTYKTESIMLVEDSAITRAMVARILVSFGYRIIEATDGEQALSLLAQEHVDLVLTDIDMPRMDGIALTSRLRAESRWRTLPVIVLSTRGSDTDKRRALSAGADAYIVKTQFSEKTLHDTLKRRLGN
ncbi:MAG: response regulator [Deltaproteobacteria bacterium]|nr:response regulator [Deltaproteobacteria bacterium]